MEVERLYEQLIEDIKSDNFELMDLIHHYSSGFKAFYCDMTHKYLEVTRQACGGAGFSANSGIPEMISDYFPQVTFEGDTTIMTQQAARFLMKTFKAINRGHEAKYPFAYLNNTKAQIFKVCTF